MLTRLLLCGLGLVCVLTLLVVALETRGADFENDWLYEDLTCAELESAYHFEVAVLDNIVADWKNCKAYADSEADAGFGELHCALIKKEGVVVQGMANDLRGVHIAKKCGANK